MSMPEEQGPAKRAKTPNMSRRSCIVSYPIERDVNDSEDTPLRRVELSVYDDPESGEWGMTYKVIPLASCL